MDYEKTMDTCMMVAIEDCTSNNRNEGVQRQNGLRHHFEKDVYILSSLY
jgi:hypothetical protein